MNALPRWFRPLAFAALLWNLLGCAAYLMDAMLSAEDIAQLSEAQQAIYAARPAWSVTATALAVWGGALGCVGLLIRKAWALPVLVLSLLGVVAQDVSLYRLAGEAGLDNTVLALQSMVLLIAVALVWLASTAKQRGWIR